MLLTTRRFSAAALVALTLLGVAVTTGTARADTGYVIGSTGYDVSYPQCGGSLPASPGFGIVGVNNGKSFTANPCFAEQMEWAEGAAQEPAVYVNTNGAPKKYRHASCARRDVDCNNYQYGRAAATYSLSLVDGVAPEVSRYWLDVETMNSWSRDRGANAEVLRGFIDVLEGAGKTVGIYSTSYQYGRIAGNYAPGLDNWVPVPEARHETAPEYCETTPSFGGGEVVMLQLWYEFDENYVC
ncbi:MAG: hypothetical protein WD557_09650 [Dehalococcoidia bacterium]